MKNILIILLLLLSSASNGQTPLVDHQKIKEDLDEILNDIAHNYVYLADKKLDWACLKNYYTNAIAQLKTEEETVLFFEYLLDEFYDNHLSLRTHRPSSYRLFAPIYLKLEEGKAIITNVWQSQIDQLAQDIIGAEVLRFNDKDFALAIQDFPTHCQDKHDPVVREWIANKVVAGRYNEPRWLHLVLSNGDTTKLDLDALVIRRDEALLTTKRLKDIGLIRINNSLGNDDLVRAFDQALDELSTTKGLIIDLRNTIFGGDTYEARGIMSRFIREPKAYQRHSFMARSENNPAVERTWVEYVSPRGKQYKQPVVVLVGRWTGSMGEGLAIGFEGMGRAEIVGSEMRRLAGEVYSFGFQHQSYGFQLSTAKLSQLNGTLREQYVPKHYCQQTTITKDETLAKGIALLEAIDQQKDSLLREELEILGAEDQTLRLLLPDVTDKFGRASTEYQYIWSLIHRQDSICVAKLRTIIDTHGWLGKTRVGAKANQAIWLIVQHADLALQERYLPLLRASVAAGESEGWHLAFLEDRILMYNKKEQLYGTQTIWDKKLKKNKIYPIQAVESVNERRASLGLDPLETYIKSNGYIFDQKK